jgi:hypothetical protein
MKSLPVCHSLFHLDVLACLSVTFYLKVLACLSLTLPSGRPCLFVAHISIWKSLPICRSLFHLEVLGCLSLTLPSVRPCLFVAHSSIWKSLPVCQPKQQEVRGLHGRRVMLDLSESWNVFDLCTRAPIEKKGHGAVTSKVNKLR